MNSDTTFTIESNSPEDTLKLGEEIGSKLKGGEVIELIGDLGTGKTVLVRGMAKGMGSKDSVQSPTFTIERIYENEDGLRLHHFDFYRIGQAGVVGDELRDTLRDPQASVVIEWGEHVRDILPPEAKTIRFKRVEKSKRLLKLHNFDEITNTY